MKNIVFLTTVNHNVGDDFIREGLVYLLKDVVGEFHQILIHKHEPLRPVPGLLKFRGLRRIWKISRKGHVERYFNRIFKADIVIQAGAPVYWISNSHDSSMAEWVKPFWHDRVAQFYKEKPVLNLAAGSCFSLQEKLSSILKHEKLTSFIRDIHRFCRVTTVRDALAKEILDGLGLKNELLPCASIFARDLFSVEPKPPEFFLINYMKLTGHYAWDPGFDADVWIRKVLEVYRIAKKIYPVKFICHNLQEIREARDIGIPRQELFYSRDHRDYIEMYSKGAGGFLNRVHGAMMLASFGRKSFVVGNDTRIQMASLIGIPAVPVSEVAKIDAKSAVDSVLNEQGPFSEAMRTVRERAAGSYRAILRESLRS
ncbi:MAG: polysaccharide pyruvyl transferase family protein [Candidatus Omnitrophota bacterium]|nr:polysaccharide pyruvyl transferase family protein [Candidatus Omnitrophota bacterium]